MQASEDVAESALHVRFQRAPRFNEETKEKGPGWRTKTCWDSHTRLGFALQQIRGRLRVWYSVLQKKRHFSPLGRCFSLITSSGANWCWLQSGSRPEWKTKRESLTRFKPERGEMVLFGQTVGDGQRSTAGHTYNFILHPEKTQTVSGNRSQAEFCSPHKFDRVALI